MVNISYTTYINLVDIRMFLSYNQLEEPSNYVAPIVFKLQWAEKVETEAHINYTLVCHMAFLAANTLLCVLITQLCEQFSKAIDLASFGVC